VRATSVCERTRLLTSIQDVPDITNPTNVALLARWDGSSWPFLVNVAWANITAAGQVRPAKFPPSGNNGAKN
jgi:hypothetical protein